MKLVKDNIFLALRRLSSYNKWLRELAQVDLDLLMKLAGYENCLDRQNSLVIAKLSRDTLSEGKVQIKLRMLQYMVKYNKLRRVANSLILRAICANGPAV
jgi:hypothetical protein